MKRTLWTLALVFALFAAVQYNDPDPLSWMSLYGSVSALFILAALGRSSRVATWLTLIAALVWAAALLPEFVAWLRMGAPTIVGTMKADKPWIEYTREFLGLVMAAIACVFLLRTNKIKKDIFSTKL